jgi:2-polyprenyl-3-methyl-5-hydroxy-6-metoxy-1,4-benzoquinol methylase
VTDLIPDLIKEIAKLNPLQEKFLGDVGTTLDPQDQADLAAYIRYGQKLGYDLSFQAQCYDLIVKDTLREQVFFQRHGRYRHRRFAELADSVYFNEAYMRKYMIGLALTSFLWPNHRAMKDFFLRVLPRNRQGRYLEIGPGHGFYMMAAMRGTSYEHFLGVDLSPESIQLTRSILGCGLFGEFHNYEVVQSDFLAWQGQGGFAAVVMGEVLEHVEDPPRFLAKIRDLAADDAFIYVTTCVCAPAVDHIYLYEKVSDITDQAEEARLGVKDSLCLPYPGLSVEESECQRLPINVAFVLEKR